MPDVRDIAPADADRIRIALAGVRAAQEELEKSVAQALLNGASVRALSWASHLTRCRSTAAHTAGRQS
jgi:hypothetical protein